MDTTSLQNVAEYQALNPTERIFVLARARGKTVIEATKEAGVNRGTPRAHWDMEKINAAILAVQSAIWNDQAAAVAHLVGPAIEELEKAVKTGDMAAIKEVFDRRWGKPLQSQQISGPGGGPIEVKGYATFNPANWDQAPDDSSAD